MVVDGRITGLSGKCKLDDPTHLRTSISVGMSLTRGPANTSRTANVSSPAAWIPCSFPTRCLR